jgi:hypothetical protein
MTPVPRLMSPHIFFRSSKWPHQILGLKFCIQISHILENPKFISFFTIARHWFLSWARHIQSKAPFPYIYT